MNPQEVRTTVTRTDLIDIVYSKNPHLSRPEARKIFESALEEISQALVRGEDVRLNTFGNFVLHQKGERIGRNPRTGVEARIKARRVLTFKPSPLLVARINGAQR